VAERLALGLDLGGTSLKHGVISEKGRVIAFGETPAGGERRHVWEALERAVRWGFGVSVRRGFDLAAIGIGSPGTVHSGVVSGFCPNISGWAGARIEEKLRKLGGLPVSADNDANVAALAEARMGAGRGVSNFVLVTVGTGIGGGIVIGGEVYRGARGAAAEIGHTVLVRGGRLCGCGRRGCLEAYANASALVRAARARLRTRQRGTLHRLIGKDASKLTARVIGRAVGEGDGCASAALDETAGALASGLVSVVHLLNPERIVIGGGLAEIRGYVARVRTALMPQILPLSKKGFRVVKARFGNRAGVVGAGLLALDEAR
jgi:glucokinase